MPGTLTSPCVYAQMGRCQAPSCSPATLDEYRALVKMACRCAGGELPAVHAELSARMRAMAAAQQYERAARIKARLARLAELEREEFMHVGPAEDYRYVLIQTGASFSKAKTFLFACGAMQEGPGLDFPPPEAQAAAVLDQARALPMPPRVEGELLETMSLVTHYLFSPPQRRGLAIRVTAELSPAAIVEQVVAAADVLGLRAPKPRASKKTGFEQEKSGAAETQREQRKS
jgi:excinuclease UvrABC nuclease subunit